MASLLYSLLFLLGVSCVLGTTTSATSIKSPHDVHKREPTGLKVELRRVDSDRNYTKMERIKRAVVRGKHRYRALTAIFSGVQTPVYSGGGEFLMNIAIGEPPNYYRAIMDTGSDLIWTQCQPCQQCFNQPTQIYNPQSSSTFSTLPCSSRYCENAWSSCDYSNYCDFNYGYGDRSSVRGYMATETFTFGTSDNSVSVPDVVFGCANDNQGTFAQFGDSGLVGLANSALSLPYQLQTGKFAYCLTSKESTSYSTLLMGSLADQLPVAIAGTTPLISNPSRPLYYYLELQGIDVGGSPLPISSDAFAINQDGSGGMMIDSGTTYSQLPSSVMNVMANALTQITNLALVDYSSYTGLPICMQLPSDGSSGVQLPGMVFHFENYALYLSGEQLWTYPASGVVCLAMTSVNGLGLSIFGNSQQINMQVVYDLQNQLLGFTPTDCDGYY
uniref:Aspartic protease n=1 Tax=Nepenthes alata TaxID=4376 RepID=A0A1L7NZU0_NEPAL|nr:aspartic protease [Nepenthes alata]